MRRHYLIISIICFIIGAYTLTLISATGTPSNLVVRTDANGSLVVTGATQVSPITQGVFTSRILRTDSSGNLQVIIGSGPISPTSVSLPASTCAAPALNEQGATTTGIAFTATPSILDCIAGTARTTLTASLFTVDATNTRINGSLGINVAAPTGTGNLQVGGNMIVEDTLGTIIRSSNVLCWAPSGISVSCDTTLSRAASLLLNSDASMRITRGTITTDLPVQTDTVTWNAAGVTFTGWKLVVTDTASAAASRLLDLQVGSNTKFYVDKSGNIIVNNATTYGITSISLPDNGKLIHGARSRLQSTADALENIINSTEAFGVQINTGTAAPSVSTCGTGTITSGSRNTTGEFTATGATACTVDFGSPAWTNTPFCVVTLRNSPTTTPYISAISTSAFTVSNLTANDVIAYHCIGRI